ncbi:MAG: hypothetical protein A2826_01830 [Candidatus Doudnabacteria bacterium RIFCSPHIGHO2_01_FULL_43_23]|uniref:Uncharacterized protein n=1 Tax=Candidatus Doudnabacteria bacterium RIFCSPHIGHO2_01_FULL_43_23 TaxID=1817822 RepID=A0A1F5NWC1_9BACT|nr:MAG: hypothetical protein A2826_01830 [Candidatus Doudnabacteria bacterium RIFCSPHIGHO2_01_FULL_43_23]
MATAYLPVVGEFEAGRLRVDEFLLDQNLPGCFAEKSAAKTIRDCLLPYFAAMEENRFHLASPAKFDVNMARMVISLITECGLDDVMLEVASLSKCDVRPGWAEEQAMTRRTWQLLEGSVDPKNKLADILRLRRPKGWTNTERLEQVLDRTLRHKVQGCIEATFKSQALQYHWKHYASKLLSSEQCENSNELRVSNPFCVLQEFLLAVAVGDRNYALVLELLSLVCTQCFLLGTKKSNSNVWIALTA